MPEKAQTTWKVTLLCTKSEAEALNEDSLFAGSSDSVPTIVTREDNPKNPDQWAIDLYCDAKPGTQILNDLRKLAPSSREKPVVEKLADEDWVTLSQKGLEPLTVGRFFVHTSNDAPSGDPRRINICIDASRAFGTGHHETTMGCLQMLDQLKRSGRRFRNIIDVGTGTGMLAFAAHHLWPHARILASDIDPVAVEVSRNNAVINSIAHSDIRFVVSNGLDHAAVRRHMPYDLIIANILAGPLVALAPQISAAAKAGTVLILAGLLDSQKAEVVAAYIRAGFRLKNVLLENEWPCLTLVKARKYGFSIKQRRMKSPLASDYFGEC